MSETKREGKWVTVTDVGQLKVGDKLRTSVCVKQGCEYPHAVTGFDSDAVRTHDAIFLHTYFRNGIVEMYVEEPEAVKREVGKWYRHSRIGTYLLVTNERGSDGNVIEHFYENGTHHAPGTWIDAYADDHPKMTGPVDPPEAVLRTAREMGLVKDEPAPAQPEIRVGSRWRSKNPDDDGPCSIVEGNGGAVGYVWLKGRAKGIAGVRPMAYFLEHFEPLPDEPAVTLPVTWNGPQDSDKVKRALEGIAAAITETVERDAMAVLTPKPAPRVDTCSRCGLRFVDIGLAGDGPRGHDYKGKPYCVTCADMVMKRDREQFRRNYNAQKDREAQGLTALAQLKSGQEIIDARRAARIESEPYRGNELSGRGAMMGWPFKP
jgi:hypothetical protein